MFSLVAATAAASAEKLADEPWWLQASEKYGLSTVLLFVGIIFIWRCGKFGAKLTEKYLDALFSRAMALCDKIEAVLGAMDDRLADMETGAEHRHREVLEGMLDSERRIVAFWKET